MPLQAKEIVIMNLTNTQLIFLSVANARDDGAATFPTARANAAAKKSAAKLLTLGLMQEVQSEASMPIWREEGKTRFSLVISQAGRAAIDCEAAVTHEVSSPSHDEADGPSKPNVSHSMAAITAAIVEPMPMKETPRAGTKQALVVELLTAKSGASLQELMTATGWLPHTTRAALTGLRKRGFDVERRPDAAGRSVYKIAVGKSLAATTTRPRAA
jgi:hypothetical protein